MWISNEDLISDGYAVQHSKPERIPFVTGGRKSQKNNQVSRDSSESFAVGKIPFFPTKEYW